MCGEQNEFANFFLNEKVNHDLVEKMSSKFKASVNSNFTLLLKNLFFVNLSF